MLSIKSFSSRRRFVGASIAIAAAVVALSPVGAQSAKASLDPRWTPWLGCWQADTTARGDSGGVTKCVAPLEGSSGVLEITVSDGRIAERRHLVADGRPVAFDENGCKGSRTAEWASNGRRVYIRSTYTCDATLAGASSELLAFASNGDWLETKTIKAGHGSIEHVDRWRDTPAPRGLPSDVASTLQSPRLATTTACASASEPLSVSDVLDALQQVDSTTVRAWIASSGQRFNLSGDELTTLVRANVPRAVLQAMVAWSPQPGAAAPGYDPDSYLRAASGATYIAGPSVVVVTPAQQASYPMYCTGGACYPANQYSSYNGYAYPEYPAPYYYPYFVPIVVTHRPFRPGIPRGLGPVGIHPFQPPAPRPPTRPVIHTGRP